MTGDAPLPLRRLEGEELLRRGPWADAEAPVWEPLVDREWLVTNGLGGYASATVSGAASRRYHALLVASTRVGRIVTLARMGERVRLPEGPQVQLDGREHAGTVAFDGTRYLTRFELRGGLPSWRYDLGGRFLEKRLFMPYQRNTVHLLYRAVGGDEPVRMWLRPYVHFRPHDAPVDAPLRPPLLTVRGDRYELQDPEGEFPVLRIWVPGGPRKLQVDPHTLTEVLHRVEAHRGYESLGALWAPGDFVIDLEPGRSVAFVASTEDWSAVTALPPEEALAREESRRVRLLAVGAGAGEDGSGVPERDGSGASEPDASGTSEKARALVEADRVAAELLLAADQFLVRPAWRERGGELVAEEPAPAEERAPAGERAAEEAPRSVVAGYHWFTDWGRDTMISLEGLTLVTGRHDEARRILRSFARHLHDGLIPNLFPEGEGCGLYHTADATLWFFHAVDRYVTYTGDLATLRLLLPGLREAVRRHREGTRFGIGVDPEDGLLTQGAEDYQLTWMDAKVGDWVVTPRRGKAVEVNALWYNALRCMARWASVLDEDGVEACAREAERVARAFNERFWYPAGAHLYDVVDGEEGDDPSLRPNQVLAISLPHPVLDRGRWEPVLAAVEEHLLTPYGLRSLAPQEAEYRPEYFGDLRARDAAYHQGTVWGWLMGPYLDARAKVRPGRGPSERQVMAGLLAHLREACLGQVSEIFDAEPPHTPRGCVAQAWSVAELLRWWMLAGPEREEAPPEEAAVAGG